MKLLNFIVVDKSLSNGNNFFTVTGECYLPLEKVVPVIKSGKGCIGVGIVKALHITSSSTEIEFLFESDISKSNKEAYYDLYKNNMGSDSSDPYETEAFIPGAMMGSGNNKKKNYRPSSSPSILDGLDLPEYY